MDGRVRKAGRMANVTTRGGARAMRTAAPTSSVHTGATSPPLLLRRASHPRQLLEAPLVGRRRELLSLLKRRHASFAETDKMNSRHKTLAMLLAVLTFALMPLSMSAAARPKTYAPSAAVAIAQVTGVTVPVAGTTSKGGKFTGNFAIKEFRWSMTRTSPSAL